MVRNKLDSIEKIIAMALIDSGIANDEFTVLINEEQIFSRLKKASK